MAWKLAPLSLLQLPYDYIKINFGADEIDKKNKGEKSVKTRSNTGDRLVIQKTDSHVSHDITCIISTFRFGKQQASTIYQLVIAEAYSYKPPTPSEKHFYWIAEAGHLCFSGWWF